MHRAYIHQTHRKGCMCGKGVRELNARAWSCARKQACFAFSKAVTNQVCHPGGLLYRTVQQLGALRQSTVPPVAAAGLPHSRSAPRPGTVAVLPVSRCSTVRCTTVQKDRSSCTHSPCICPPPPHTHTGFLSWLIALCPPTHT